MNNKKRLLLHACCAPCSTVPFKRLKDKGYDVTFFFYNTNIFPKEEEWKRRKEAIDYYKKHGIKYFIDAGDRDLWSSMIEGFEKEPEGGKRCVKCFDMRLRKTAIVAKKNGFNAIAATLSVSPHKDSKKVNEVGRNIAKEFEIEFIDEDFGENDGFKESCEISEQEGFYRQKYCGCEFSMR